METTKKTPSIIPFTQTTGKNINQGYDANAARHLQEKVIFGSNDVFRSVWENSLDGLCLTDANGIIVAVNRVFCEMFGKAEDEIIGCNHTDLFGDGVEKGQFDEDHRERFATGKITQRFHRTYQLWSGKRLESEVVSTFVNDEKGNRLMFTQFRDVTKEREAHRSLKLSEEKYRNLFANSPMPIFQSSVEGKVINANAAFLRLLGYESFYEFIDMDVSTTFFANADEQKDFVQTLEQRGYIVNTELHLRRKNGRILTVLETSRAIKDAEGTMIGFEGMLEDVTARKTIERKLHEYVWALEKSKKELSELNAQKDKLFSILSHDLRSPFSSILGFCDILIREYDQLKSDESLQFVNYIQEAAQDQLTLVNKLLDWSRLESGRIKIDYADINLHDLAEKTIRSLQGLARQKNITLISTVSDRAIVRGDHSWLSQVFGNIVGNALKFTPAQGTIAIELIEEKQSQWVIAIRDTGVGIPEADLPKLFHIEEKYTRKGLSGEKGTGLGLPIVAEIVEKHHGTISVQSKVDEGTTFVISLPKSMPHTGEQVLIVDDEHGIRVLHARYIQRAFPDVNILHASDGREAFHLACEYQPRLIISDSDMNGLDGDKLVYQLKSNPATKDIPIVIVTGHDSETDRDLLLQNGVAEILVKPVAPENLTAVITKFFQKSAIK
ncbi:MAG TPA: PAS domain S-box protein [Bacteroidota bacterium]|nr:PAS domain S-box protein [Bacteroidota bacterium]